jgi:ribosomal protein S18 acetylase RimI-like enzyme
MNTAIRPFSWGDRARLKTTIDTVCDECGWMSTPGFQPTHEWTHVLLQPTCERHLLLVVEVERVIVGWCRVFPTGSCETAPQDYSLGIGLLTAYRDQGIGTSLVGTALRWAEFRVARQVVLETRRENRRAIHVFEKSGFRVHGQTANDLVTMQYTQEIWQ